LNPRLPVIELARDETGTLLAGSQDGLRRLEGERWERIPGVGTKAIEALVRLPDGTLLAGHRDGLCRSTDEGHTWRLHSLGGATVTAIAPDPHHPGRALLGTDGLGAWRTEDSGVRWERLPPRGINLTSLAGLYPDPLLPGHVVARV